MRFIDSYLPPGVNHYGPRAGLKPQAVVFHVTAGTWSSVVHWFHSPTSGASTNYMIRKDGAIFRFVREGEGPYANGRICKPNLADPLISGWVNAGINPNHTTISIETEGQPWDELTPAQLLAACELARDIHLRWGFPLDGSRIMGHYEFDGCDRPNCPSFSPYEWATITEAVQTGVMPGGGVAPIVKPGERFFPETGFTVKGEILAFWERQGGVQDCGYPLGGEWWRDAGVKVQLFENVRIGHYTNGTTRFEGLGQELIAERRKNAG